MWYILNSFLMSMVFQNKIPQHFLPINSQYILTIKHNIRFIQKSSLISYFSVFVPDSKSFLYASDSAFITWLFEPVCESNPRTNIEFSCENKFTIQIWTFVQVYRNWSECHFQIHNVLKILKYTNFMMTHIILFLKLFEENIKWSFMSP